MDLAHYELTCNQRSAHERPPLHAFLSRTSGHIALVAGAYRPPRSFVHLIMHAIENMGAQHAGVRRVCACIPIYLRRYFPFRASIEVPGAMAARRGANERQA